MAMKTVREATLGKVRARLVETATGFIAIAHEGSAELLRVTDADGEAAWNALMAQVGRAGPNWFGLAGARARFLHWFARGFSSPAYCEQEREYKLAAKRRLEQTAPVEEAATGSGHGEAVLRAFRDTSLLYMVEKTRLQALLRGPDADAFVRAAARFALGEMRTGLRAMETLLRPHDNAKWTVVTYLPFLWRPDTHIFLKPEVTKDFAERIGHSFVRSYSSELDLGVYEDLLDLAGTIRTAFADLGPRDMIDVQGVIWVAGDYRDGRETPQE